MPLPDTQGWPSDWSSDGRYLLLYRPPTQATPHEDVLLYDLTTHEPQL